jgi:tryptophanyl-tRNA synthetase
LREDPEQLTQKLRTMPTDPARVRRTDPGTPEKCPVWLMHQVYSDAGVRDWVRQGCTSAGIGCLDCKQPIVDAVLAELEPIRDRAEQYIRNPNLVRNIIEAGCDAARTVARETLQEVRAVMGLGYK